LGLGRHPYVQYIPVTVLTTDPEGKCAKEVAEAGAVVAGLFIGVGDKAFE
jgi:hypothetical protein